ncbi:MULTISPECIES: hypothetical protein [Enterovibrio]|uniref:hypothetical protein n=1 Tax=Enterovibrio TaxID=188143 RepID=UPI0024B258CB|nr:hypothetical protein [Enterovibrio norvegicus]
MNKAPQMAATLLTKGRIKGQQTLDSDYHISLYNITGWHRIGFTGRRAVTLDKKKRSHPSKGESVWNIRLG